MRKIGFFYLMFVLAFALPGCEDPSLVGSDFINGEPLTVTYYDTVSINLSTIKFDSLSTSNASRLLVGKTSDQYLGTISATPFFQVGRDSLSTYPEEEKAGYDSLTLEMVFDGYFHGDTTNYQIFYLYSLIDEMEVGDDGFLYNVDSYLYITDSVNYLGELRLKPRPNNKKEVYLKIDDNYGEALFQLLLEKDEIVTDDADFSSYIRGFALVADSANTCVLGLDSETNFKLFYTQDGEQVEQKFPIADNTHFTHYAVEDAEYLYGNLTTQKDKLASEESDDIGFVLGGMGLGLRIEFPYLDYIRELGDTKLVTEAELIISPVKHSYSGINPLTTNLTAYQVDKYNNVISEVSIDPLLYYDDEYNDDTFYVININTFMENQLQLLENDGSALLIALTESANSGTVNRIFVGNDQHESKSYLRLLVMNVSDTFN